MSTQKRISRFEHKFNQALGIDDSDCYVMTNEEQEEEANEKLKQSLSRFKNATTGEKLFPGFINNNNKG